MTGHKCVVAARGKVVAVHQFTMAARGKVVAVHQFTKLNKKLACKIYSHSAVVALLLRT